MEKNTNTYKSYFDGCISFNGVLTQKSHTVSHNALGYPKVSDLTQNIRKEGHTSELFRYNI